MVSRSIVARASGSPRPMLARQSRASHAAVWFPLSIRGASPVQAASIARSDGFGIGFRKNQVRP